jgi:hypothetical protein
LFSQGPSPESFSSSISLLWRSLHCFLNTDYANINADLSLIQRSLCKLRFNKRHKCKSLISPFFPWYWFIKRHSHVPYRSKLFHHFHHIFFRNITCKIPELDCLRVFNLDMLLLLILFFPLLYDSIHIKLGSGRSNSILCV